MVPTTISQAGSADSTPTPPRAEVAAPLTRADGLDEAARVKSRVRRRVEMQGFIGLNDRDVQTIAPWLRLAPAICMAWAAVGTVLGSATVTIALAPFAFAGAVGRGHPFDLLYQRGVCRMLRSPAIPPYGAPRRFACALATVWLLAMAATLHAGHLTAGRVLGAGLVVTASVIVTTGFCVPSWIYGRLLGRPRSPARQGALP